MLKYQRIALEVTKRTEGQRGWRLEENFGCKVKSIKVKITDGH